MNNKKKFFCDPILENEQFNYVGGNSGPAGIVEYKKKFKLTSADVRVYCELYDITLKAMYYKNNYHDSRYSDTKYYVDYDEMAKERIGNSYITKKNPTFLQVFISLTRKEIAAALGISVRTVIRAINKLKKIGLVYNKRLGRNMVNRTFVRLLGTREEKKTNSGEASQYVQEANKQEKLNKLNPFWNEINTKFKTLSKHETLDKKALQGISKALNNDSNELDELIKYCSNVTPTNKRKSYVPVIINAAANRYYKRPTDITAPGCTISKKVEVYNYIESNDFNSKQCEDLENDSFSKQITAAKEAADEAETYGIKRGIPYACIKAAAQAAGMDLKTYIEYESNRQEISCEEFINQLNQIEF